MTGRLDTKSCVVTGAGQGIGRAIAEAFLREGASVLAIDLNKDMLESWTRGTSARTAVLDVTHGQAISAIASTYTDINVLVNCVGMVRTDTALTCTPDDLELAFRINVVTMLGVIKAFLPAMLDRQDGSIINIASVVSSEKGAPDRFSYGTTKAAVIGLTKSVARDFISQGIRCNAISPGTVDSPSLAERMAAQGNVEAARAAFVARQPMGRIGSPEEIATIAVLLASDEARFMSGSNIVIDGGVSL